jgi:hypothetical protein
MGAESSLPFSQQTAYWPYHYQMSRYQWLCNRRSWYATAILLGLRVRIPPGHGFLSLCGCLLSGRVLCDRPFTTQEESYQVWWFWPWSWSPLEGVGAKKKLARRIQSKSLYLICLNLILILFSHLFIFIPSGFFLTDLSIKMTYTFVFIHIHDHTIWSTHFA